jgi:creatinase
LWNINVEVHRRRLELIKLGAVCKDTDTALEPGMVVSMEPMITVADGQPGADGYREHDILVVTVGGAENITKVPFGLDHSIID